MLINKIPFFQATNNVANRNFATVAQNRPILQPIGQDTVSFSGRQKSDAENIEEIRDMLAFLRRRKGRDRKFDVELLYIIAMLDVLTGLKNKRAFFADIEKDVKSAKKHGETVSVAMFDMDYFKSINDLFDHKVGDKFLQVIGSKIDKVAKKHGYQAYRFGGEEFIITMPGADVNAASKIAEGIRKSINKNPVLQGHYNDYLASAQKKKDKLQGEQKPFVDFKDRLKEYEVKEYCFEGLKKKCTDGVTKARITPFLDEELTDSMRVLKAALQRLLEYAIINESSASKKKYLGDKIKSLTSSGGDVKAVYDDDLKNYLNTHFNKEFEIAQIGTWASHAKNVVNGKSQGFTITAGVKEFKDLDVPIEDFEKKTDAVLMQGKNECRGRVYAEAA